MDDNFRQALEAATQRERQNFLAWANYTNGKLYERHKRTAAAQNELELTGVIEDESQ